MKIALAYYLLFFYAVALFKPVLPFASDFLAHSFSPQKHLQTVHRDHGAEHVHFEVAKASNDAQHEQNAPRTTFAEPVSVHLLSADESYALPFSALRKRTFPFFISAFTSQFVGVDIPPPKEDFLIG